MNYFWGNNERGFTLIEMLISMAIGLIIIVALSSTFLLQRDAYDDQEQIVEMVQNARAAMDIMSREIRMAGYDPTGLAGAGIVSVVTDKIYITMDLNGDGVLDDSGEHIVYDIYDNTLGRTVGQSANVNNPSVSPYHQPLAENIEDLQIFQSGNSINVFLTARTSKPDRNYTPNSGYRTYTITSYITPRNLAL